MKKLDARVKQFEKDVIALRKEVKRLLKEQNIIIKAVSKNGTDNR